MNFWVASVDARNREYAQLMRKFQVETNLHDASKRTLSEQLHTNHTLKVCILMVLAHSQITKSNSLNLLRACNASFAVYRLLVAS